MPVRSLDLSVFTWPDRQRVEQALRRWAEWVVQSRGGVRRIGYFGSYARGDWSMGSDLDVIVIVDAADQPFERRPVSWDLTGLPVPADVLVYTEDEWRSLDPRSRFHETLTREVIWVCDR
jgi:predicted nucleotidyltransferase